MEGNQNGVMHKQEVMVTDDAEQPATVYYKEGPRRNVEDSLHTWVTSSATWSSSWLKSAKEKTYTTLELVRKDLAEFGDVVVSEASALAYTTVESVKQRAHNLQQIISLEEDSSREYEEKKKGRTEVSIIENEQSSLPYPVWTPKLLSVPTLTNSTWMRTIVDAVKNIAQENTVEVEDQSSENNYPEIKLVGRSDLPHHILYGIQTNPGTFIDKPEGDEKLFKMWCSDFRLNEYDGEINALLANCPPMRALYQKLVPAEIENMLFWERYFYKVHQAELLAGCKIDADKQLAKCIRNKAEQDEKQTSHSDGTESLAVDVDTLQGRNSPDRRSATDESWSLCSSTNVDLQDLHDELKDGSQTPKAGFLNNCERNDGWLKWDE